MNRKGVILDPSQDPQVHSQLPLWNLFAEYILIPLLIHIKIDKDSCIRLYHVMILLNKLDTVMYEAQRQGRISFYLTSHGESAAQVGSSYGLDPEDLVFGEQS